jgi:hypothetical protein
VRAAALNRSGFEVFSTSIESHARMEIETGRCGVLLICFRVPPGRAKELARFFRRNVLTVRSCFVVNDTKHPAADADIFVAKSKAPGAIVEALRSELRRKSA